MDRACVYILELDSGAYYTGYTIDLARRIDEHLQKKKGSKITRSFRPIRLVISWRTPDRSTALRLEHAIKTLTRQDKDRLIQNPRTLRSFFPEISGARLFRRDIPLAE